jgi:transcription termination factor NusB
MDLPPEVGFDNMKMISSIKGSSAREEAVQALMEEEASPDTVRVQIKDSSMKEDEKEALHDPKKKLQKEKEKIEKSIKTLNEKLEKVEKMIEDLD